MSSSNAVAMQADPRAVGKFDLEQSIRQAVSELTDSDCDRGAMAAATLTLLAQQADDREPLLHGAIGKLMRLVTDSGGALKKNACVALISIIQLGPQCWQAASEESVVVTAVGLMRGSKLDPGLRVNGFVLAGVMIEGGPGGPEAFYAAGGLEALQQILLPDTEPPLLETAVDDVCKLAAEPSARQPLLDAGVLADLAGLLGVQEQPEVLVRALMACAMLLGDDRRLLRSLAATPGTARALGAIMRNKGDADCATIAASLFKAMAEDEEAKKLLAADLQS